MPYGNYTLSYTLSDGSLTASDTAKVAVVQTPLNFVVIGANTTISTTSEARWSVDAT
jgi:hypothetical protein